MTTASAIFDRLFFLAALGICFLTSDATGADEFHVPHKTTAEALNAFDSIDGFEMQLVASEPQVKEPIVITYDENGLLYVAEYLKFPWDGVKGGEGNGRIRLLRDEDGDGQYEKAVVFADEIEWPTGICHWKGGIFVIAAPDLWYFKDEDGDGVADIRRKIFTGFGFVTEEGTANNLTPGLDNWIYGAGSNSGGEVRPADQPNAKTVSMRGHDFRFDPVTGKFEAISGSEQFGNTFDDWGNRFLCQNSKPGVHVVLPSRYLARNPYLPVSKVRKNIWEGDQIYRASPSEPWRVVRSKERKAKNPKMAAPYVQDDVFTAVSGVTVYRGAAYPAEFRGNIFFGEVQSNLIHRRVLEPDGVSFNSKRVDEKTEILRSTDNWFRPVNMTNAPDGTLHIADMYREIIETPTSMTPDILAKVNLASGHDRGRIYRLARSGFEPPAPPNLGTASTADLVKELENPNGWWRVTAQRLIHERQDKAAIAPLRVLLKDSQSDLARLHALHSLKGLGALSDMEIAAALNDSSPGIREHALRLAEQRMEKNQQIRNHAIDLAKDNHIRVRFQLALSLGETRGEDAARALVQISLRDPEDYWMQTAVLSSSLNLASDMIAELLKQDGSRQLSGQLAQLVGSRNQKEEIERLLKSAGESNDTRMQRTLILGLGDGLVRSRSSLAPYLEQFPAAAKLLSGLIENAKNTLENPSSSAAQKKSAIKTLAHADIGDAEAPLATMLNRAQSPDVQLSALNTLSGFNSPQAASRIAGALPNLSPSVKNEAIESLLGRKTWIPALLNAVADGKLTTGSIAPARRAALMKSPDKGIQKQATELFSGSVPRARDKVIASYQAALKLKGNPERGQQVAEQTCIACHKIGKKGQDVGPNLGTIQNRSASDLLVHILDPNREVQANYTQYIVELKDGRLISGFITTESPTSITLKRIEGIQETLLRQNIKKITSSQISLMPVGLEQIINQQQMSDLLAYLLNLKK